jgi:hypothetical protein
VTSVTISPVARISLSHCCITLNCSGGIVLMSSACISANALPIDAFAFQPTPCQLMPDCISANALPIDAFRTSVLPFVFVLFYEIVLLKKLFHIIVEIVLYIIVLYKTIVL